MGSSTYSNFPDEYQVELVLKGQKTKEPAKLEEPSEEFKGILNNIENAFNYQSPPKEVWVDNIKQEKWAIFLIEKKIFLVDQELQPGQLVKLVWYQPVRHEKYITIKEKTRFIFWN
jgi:hypothetical protein